MRKSSREIIDQSNQTGVQFLFAELKTASTFLDVANVTQVVETRDRNRAHAWKAYCTALRLMPRVVPSPEEAAELEKQITQLKKELEEVGYFSDPHNGSASA
jgi:hypothetical protein